MMSTSLKMRKSSPVFRGHQQPFCGDLFLITFPLHGSDNSGAEVRDTDEAVGATLSPLKPPPYPTQAR